MPLRCSGGSIHQSLSSVSLSPETRMALEKPGALRSVVMWIVMRGLMSVQSSLTLEWESIPAPLVFQNTCWNISDSDSGLGGGISGRHGPGSRNQCVSWYLWESPELTVLLKRRQWKRIRRNKNRRSQRNEWWRWVKRGQPKRTATGRRRELGSFSIMTP